MSPNSQRPNRPDVIGSPSNSGIKTSASQNPGASGVRHRTRAERVAAHFTYNGFVQHVFDGLRNTEIRKHVALVILTTLAMCVATQAWTPPFPFAEYDVPDRDIVCRVAFTFHEEIPFPPFPPPTGHHSETEELYSQAMSEEGYGQDTTSEQHPTVTSVSPSAGSVAREMEEVLSGQLVLSESREQSCLFVPGMVIIKAGQVISQRDIRILFKEYREMLSQRSWSERLSRFCGAYFLTLALFFLAIIFLRRRERRRPQTTLGSVLLYFQMIVTVIAATLMHWFFENGGANPELIPILLFAQGIAVAFSWELALLLTMIVSFVFVLSQANSIFTMVLLVGVSASVIIHLGRLRSRTKLVAVGSFGAVVAFLLTICIQMTEGQEITKVILIYAVLNAFWTCMAAFLMTGLLPFIERPCGILTDMSLLELGDPTHPLIHELTRRAPATFSHSLQVASIAETAAEAIGARGLLVRVGAYFHDIGKILNPEYFTENQQDGQNVHDHLEPRMSTLVIVAHVKDGVDLARQHRIPQPIVNMVEQHHGTSLVSFFYTLAAKQNRDQGYNSSIDEGSFRYPGPKPQSKEAGILMLADASESACRSLRDTTPGKIEAMVRHVFEDKLKDGQFDESGLTLRELRTIENSIINSILAVRHNRISYPTAGGRKVGDSSEIKPQIASATVEPE